MSSSVGIIIPNIWKVIKVMFQTTDQPFIVDLLIENGGFPCVQHPHTG